MPPRGEVSADASEAWRGRPRLGRRVVPLCPGCKWRFSSPALKDPCQQW
jgi:hypothetical protein